MPLRILAEGSIKVRKYVSAREISTDSFSRNAKRKKSKEGKRGEKVEKKYRVKNMQKGQNKRKTEDIN
jgi:hypothetical protein